VPHIAEHRDGRSPGSAFGELRTAGIVSPMDVTDATFASAVIERSAAVPVVVDFWAEWCGPCRTLGPVLEREVEARGGAIELAKIDVDANRVVSQQFGIASIPAVKAFRDGRVVSEFVGARSPTAVSAFLDELLAPPRADALVESLRADGAFPDVLAALELDDVDGALATIVAMVPAATADDRERLRDLAVALFERLGHEDPLAVTFRRRLAAALY
jgi:putative thioredoxin